MTARGSNKSTEAIREMIDHRLKSISASTTMTLPPESHLDEDTISAFVEGRLSAVESKPVLSHLTDCGSCRLVSAHLLRLENQIDDEIAASPEEPGRLQAFISNLQSLVGSPGEDVVFAYQHPEAEEDREESNQPTDKPGSPEKKIEPV